MNDSQYGSDAQVMASLFMPFCVVTFKRSMKSQLYLTRECCDKSEIIYGCIHGGCSFPRMGQAEKGVLCSVDSTKGPRQPVIDADK